MAKEAILTSGAPAAVGPYSQAVSAGGFVYVSGQLGLDSASGNMVAGGVREQARQALDNIGAILKAACLDWSSVVKTTIYLTDMADFGEVNQVYADVVDEPYPARACVEVSALPKGGLVEIEAVALAE